MIRTVSTVLVGLGGVCHLQGSFIFGSVRERERQAAKTPRLPETSADVAHIETPKRTLTEQNRAVNAVEVNERILKTRVMPPESNFTRFVEVGRVVLLKNGPHAGHIAVIAEIIDHNRAIIDGPTTGVPRQAFPYRHLTLTSLAVPKLPRSAGSGTVKKYVEEAGIVAKWESSAWAKKRSGAEKRRTLSDFERFQVMVHKKSRRDKVRKVIKAAKA